MHAGASGGLSPSGPWSALWTPHPRQSQRRAVGRSWSRALQSHPGSDDGKQRQDEMMGVMTWLWSPVTYYRTQTNSTPEVYQGFIPHTNQTLPVIKNWSIFSITNEDPRPCYKCFISRNDNRCEFNVNARCEYQCPLLSVKRKLPWKCPVLTL